ncbi:caspase family protein [Bosea sp. Tri-44]|uniref:caspase family protein n=1 Tax=Bosea sp. Tri-44 TaxID=1972137 RepID=UPI0020BE75A5|nr:caspase family protein [Bosea sp. Tri-44]
MPAFLLAVLLWFGLVSGPIAQTLPATLSDNAESIAVVIGNKAYKQTSTVDFAHNDAEAIKAWLTGTLGFREQNVFLLKDATLSELNQVFGSEVNPQAGRLWRSVSESRSNVFVYYSGHGVPDLATRQPFLLPQDGNPNLTETGYSLQALYRNLELVRQKIGSQRQLIVMIDACFTGETGRKGESLLAVSAPGFTPARPRAGGSIVKLVATSGATPANWDEKAKLGLFTSRFLMGAAGLAQAGQSGSSNDMRIVWSELQSYVVREVEAAARRDSGREQAPEIDEAAIVLPVALPVPAVARAVGLTRDEANWRRAKAAGERSALEGYIARCGEICQYREVAMELLLDRRRSAEAATDEQNWQRLSAAGQYEEYLKGCRVICAYRTVAQGYLRLAHAKSDGDAEKLQSGAAQPSPTEQPGPAPAPLLTPSQPASAPLKPEAGAPGNDPQVIKALQVELKRVGCHAGAIDGEWGASTQQAMRSFNRHAGAKLDTGAASPGAVEKIRAQPRLVCPGACSSGQRLSAGRCVAVKDKTEKVKQAKPAPSIPPLAAGQNEQRFRNSSGQNVVVRARTVRTYVENGQTIRVVERIVYRDGVEVDRDQVKVNLATNQASGI